VEPLVEGQALQLVGQCNTFVAAVSADKLRKTRNKNHHKVGGPQEIKLNPFAKPHTEAQKGRHTDA